MSLVGQLLRGLLATEAAGQARAAQLGHEDMVLAADTVMRRAAMAATALPLLGRYADDDGPLARPEPVQAPQSGNRWQRRAKAAATQLPAHQIDPLDVRRPRTSAT